MESTAIADRMKEFLSYKRLSARAFERKCSLGNGVLKKLSESTSQSTLQKIQDSSELNVNWLLTGDGEMIIENSSLTSNASDFDGEVSQKYMTHLVPMAAMGGGLIGFEDEGIRKCDCEKVVSPIAGADWAIPVYGDSMEPEYPNGSRVFVRQINPNDFIAWGNVFVLDTTNGIIIKVVVKSDKKGCVRCISLNPSGRYQPFEVPMSSVRAMYRVMACVSAK